MYSGPDRGREGLNDGINLQLPSGNALAWGNVDFDVNLSITNPAFEPDGQLFFDIFDTDGFLGDMLFVNGAYYPYMEVLPRRYRFRTLNASMARFIKLALVVQKASSFAAGTKVPFHFIANDGNFVVKPMLTTARRAGRGRALRHRRRFLEVQAGRHHLPRQPAEADRRPQARRRLSMAQALAGVSDDPCVGPILQFRVVPTMRSVDDPSVTYDYSVANGDRASTSAPATGARRARSCSPTRSRSWRRCASA